jgi:hypothetical protein
MMFSRSICKAIPANFHRACVEFSEMDGITVNRIVPGKFAINPAIGSDGGASAQ